MNSEKLLSILYRGLTVFGRFCLTFLIAKQISLELLADYTLISTTIAILVMLIGFDFYVFSTRRISVNNESPIFILKNQVFIHGIVFFVFCFLSITYFTFFESPIDIEVCLILLIILFFEHLSQELFRLYLILQKTLFANVLLFIRSGFWSLILCIYLFFYEIKTLDIDTIMYLWLFSAISSVIIGFIFFPEINKFKRQKIDFSWLKKGGKIALLLFSATIALKIMEYSDRYFIAYYLPKKDLGIYSFFFQLYNLFNVVLYTIVISFVYPLIFTAIGKGQKEKVDKLKKEIINKTILYMLIYLVLFYLFIPLLIENMEREELNEYKNIFYILLFGGGLLNIGYAYHFILIAEENDSMIIKSTFFAALSNILSNILLIPLLGIYGAAFSFLVSSVVLLSSKYYFFLISREKS